MMGRTTPFPIGSMYGVFTSNHTFRPNVGKYSIHAASGLCRIDSLCLDGRCSMQTPRYENGGFEVSLAETGQQSLRENLPSGNLT